MTKKDRKSMELRKKIIDCLFLDRRTDGAIKDLEKLFRAELIRVLESLRMEELTTEEVLEKSGVPREYWLEMDNQFEAGKYKNAYNDAVQEQNKKIDQLKKEVE